MWPVYPLVGGHQTFPNGHLTIPKKATKISKESYLQNVLGLPTTLFYRIPVLCDLDLIIFDQESLEYAHDFRQVITNITNSPVATVDGHNPLMDVKLGYVFLEKKQWLVGTTQIPVSTVAGCLCFFPR